MMRPMTSGTVIKVLAAVSCLLLIGGLFAGCSLNKPKVEAVKVVTIPITGAAPLFIGIEKGYFREAGLEVTYDTVQTGANMIPLLATGGADVGTIGTTAAALFNAHLNGTFVKIIAGETLSYPGQASGGMVVRKDLKDQIKAPKDLKGKKIAITGKASAMEMAINNVLKQGGLTIKDVELVEMSLADMTAALANKAIDVAEHVEPALALAVEQGIAVPFLDLGQQYNGLQVTAVMGSPKFLKERAAVAERFLRTWLRGVDYYTQAVTKKTNWDEFVGILTKHTVVKDASVYPKISWPPLDPKLNMQSLKDTMEYYVQQGYIPKAVNLSEVVDTSIVDLLTKK